MSRQEITRSLQSRGNRGHDGTRSDQRDPNRPRAQFLALFLLSLGATACNQQSHQSKVGTAHTEDIAGRAAKVIGEWKAGEQYQVLGKRSSVTEAQKVFAYEFFSYDCPHCDVLEAPLAQWVRSKPSYIEFSQVPIVWGPDDVPYARLFYTLEALSRSDLHLKVFDMIHRQHQKLSATSADASLMLQADFAEQNGIARADFMQASRSAQVADLVERARQLTDYDQVDGIPCMVVSDLYKVGIQLPDGDPRQMFAVVMALSNYENQRRTLVGNSSAAIPGEANPDR